jgi:DNA-binding NtrC family response regulator
MVTIKRGFSESSPKALRKCQTYCAKFPSSTTVSRHTACNVIERSVILCETEILSIDENWLSQQPPLTPESKHQVELPRRLILEEKNMIEAALKDTRGRVSGPTGAAVKLGIPRSTLESKIRSLKIDKNRFKRSTYE